MSKKNRKRTSAPPNRKTAAKKKSPRVILIVAAIAAVAVVAVIALSTGAGGGAAPSASEQKYLGRLLPQGYEEPKVVPVAVYSETVGMTPATATQDGSGFSLPLDSVVQNKIVKFAYQRPGGDTLPMIAYVKPSGKLFVGVSYCPPCQGEGQRIEADGTLTCESCGTKRNLETEAGLSGACKLYPLDEVPAKVQGDSILVDSSVLDSWTPQPLDRPVG